MWVWVGSRDMYATEMTDLPSLSSELRASAPKSLQFPSHLRFPFIPSWSARKAASYQELHCNPANLSARRSAQAKLHAENKKRNTFLSSLCLFIGQFKEKKKTKQHPFRGRLYPSWLRFPLKQNRREKEKQNRSCSPRGSQPHQGSGS